jgi:ABC-type transporter Mla MlaB component
MLRITRIVGNDSVDTLKLEGKLQGPWILEADVAHALAASQPSRTCLDLSGLTFADGEGAALLRELIRTGAQVVGCSSYIAELLQASAGS